MDSWICIGVEAFLGDFSEFGWKGFRSPMTREILKGVSWRNLGVVLLEGEVRLKGQKSRNNSIYLEGDLQEEFDWKEVNQREFVWHLGRD